MSAPESTPLTETTGVAILAALARINTDDSPITEATGQAILAKLAEVEALFARAAGPR